MEILENENMIMFPPYKNLFASQKMTKEYEEYLDDKTKCVKDKPDKKYEKYLILYFIDFGEKGQFTDNYEDIYKYKVSRFDLKTFLSSLKLDPYQFIHPTLEYDIHNSRVNFGEIG